MSEFFNRVKTNLALNALEVVIFFGSFITAIGVVASSTTISPILIIGIMLLISSIFSALILCYRDSK